MDNLFSFLIPKCTTGTSIMILKISFRERIYLTKVESTKYGYSFRFKEENSQFDWAYFFYFQKFRCSLK